MGPEHPKRCSSIGGPRGTGFRTKIPKISLGVGEALHYIPSPPPSNEHYGDRFFIWAAGPARGLGDPVSVHIKKNIGRRKLDLRQSKSRRVRKSNLAEM